MVADRCHSSRQMNAGFVDPKWPFKSREGKKAYVRRAGQLHRDARSKPKTFAAQSRLM